MYICLVYVKCMEESESYGKLPWIFRKLVCPFCHLDFTKVTYFVLLLKLPYCIRMFSIPNLLHIAREQIDTFLVKCVRVFGV